MSGASSSSWDDVPGGVPEDEGCGEGSASEAGEHHLFVHLRADHRDFHRVCHSSMDDGRGGFLAGQSVACRLRSRGLIRERARHLCPNLRLKLSSHIK